MFNSLEWKDDKAYFDIMYLAGCSNKEAQVTAARWAMELNISNDEAARKIASRLERKLPVNMWRDNG